MKKLLGHKGIENTLKYTQLIEFGMTNMMLLQPPPWKKPRRIVATGFDYAIEMNGIKIFRKPKRYDT